MLKVSGWNQLVGADKEEIINATHHSSPISNHALLVTHYGDGRAWIVETLFLAGGRLLNTLEEKGVENDN